MIDSLRATCPHCGQDLGRRKNATAEAIYVALEEKTGYGKRAIVSGSRKQHIAEVRWMAVWLLRELTSLSFQSIGDLFHRDHSTIMYGVKVEAARQLTDLEHRKEMDNIIAAVKTALGAE